MCIPFYQKNRLQQKATKMTRNTEFVMLYVLVSMWFYFQGVTSSCAMLSLNNSKWKSTMMIIWFLTGQAVPSSHVLTISIQNWVPAKQAIDLWLSTSTLPLATTTTTSYSFSLEKNSNSPLVPHRSTNCMFYYLSSSSPLDSSAP